MKITSLVLASTFAAALLSAPPVLAQSRNVPGSSDGGSMNNGSAAVGGESQSGEHGGNWRGRSGQDSTGAGVGGMAWRHGGPVGRDEGTGIRQRMMERHRRMMMGALLGPRIRLSRGNARIDVQCGPRDDMKTCVNAATELLDKVAGMHHRAQRQGATSGSGVTPPTSSEERGQAPDANTNEDEDQNLDNTPTQNNPGERM